MLSRQEINFAKEWASTGDIVEAYSIAYDTEGRSDYAIERSAVKLSRRPEIKSYYDDLLRRAEEIKLAAVRLDKADITDMLTDAYDLAKKAKDPAIMVRAATNLAKFHVPTLVEESIIARNNNMNKNDDDLLGQYNELMKELADNLPD